MECKLFRNSQSLISLGNLWQVKVAGMQKLLSTDMLILFNEYVIRLNCLLLLLFVLCATFTRKKDLLCQEYIPGPCCIYVPERDKKPKHRYPPPWVCRLESSDLCRQLAPPKEMPLALPVSLQVKEDSWCYIIRNTKSENHGIFEIGKGRQRAALRLEQGYLQPVPKDHDQMAFEYLPRGRLYNFSGQPVTVLDHPHSNKVFPDVLVTPMFQLLPITCGPVRRHHWKQAGSIPSAIPVH